jgi:murein DD-endopeptidase MepM/ murein hydrolase activator NlpD
VVFAGWSPVGYGYLVEVDHGNGYKTGYAHLSRIDVSVGQTVGKGQVVGLMGATGRAWGVHLHFMIWESGRFINPLSVL